jgi:hypothetical protein
MGHQFQGYKCAKNKATTAILSHDVMVLSDSVSIGYTPFVATMCPTLYWFSTYCGAVMALFSALTTPSMHLVGPRCIPMAYTSTVGCTTLWTAPSQVIPQKYCVVSLHHMGQWQLDVPYQVNLWDHFALFEQQKHQQYHSKTQPPSNQHHAQVQDSDHQPSYYTCPSSKNVVLCCRPRALVRMDAGRHIVHLIRPGGWWTRLWWPWPSHLCILVRCQYHECPHEYWYTYYREEDIDWVI